MKLTSQPTGRGKEENGYWTRKSAWALGSRHRCKPTGKPFHQAPILLPFPSISSPPFPSISSALNWNILRNNGGGVLFFKSRLPRDTQHMTPGLLKHSTDCARRSLQGLLSTIGSVRPFCSSLGVTAWHPARVCQRSAFVNKGFVIPRVHRLSSQMLIKSKQGHDHGTRHSSMSVTAHCTAQMMDCDLPTTTHIPLGSREQFLHVKYLTAPKYKH